MQEPDLWTDFDDLCERELNGEYQDDEWPERTQAEYEAWVASLPDIEVDVGPSVPNALVGTYFRFMRGH